MAKAKKRLERGTRDWWIALALDEAADRYRKKNILPAKSSVEINMAEINAIIDEWNTNIFKRIWLLVTRGAVTELELGDEVKLKY